MTEAVCQGLLVARLCDECFFWLSLWNLMKRHVVAHDPRVDNSEVSKSTGCKPEEEGKGKDPVVM